VPAVPDACTDCGGGTADGADSARNNVIENTVASAMKAALRWNLDICPS
jgi:hypothetical protein